MDINAIVQSLVEGNELAGIVANSLAQFGVNERSYLGARLLPEQNRDSNMYSEELIKYRTPVANDGTRFSPVQFKKGAYVGSMDVKLSDSDLGMMLDGSEYDALIKYLKNGREPEAMGLLVGFADRVNRGLVELNEIHRWEAIVEGKVLLRGDNGYEEDVMLPSIPNQRVNTGAWGDVDYDIMEDILARRDWLTARGYTPNMIITSTAVANLIAKNNTLKAMVNTQATLARLTSTQVNQIMEDNELPSITKYDLTYQTQTSFANRFLRQDAFVMVATSGRNQEIELPTGSSQTLPNTIGYYAVGLAQGQSEAGRIITVIPKLLEKPIHISYQGWQTSFPVITEMEAFNVATVDMTDGS